jgi:hypothetical protein
MPPHASMARSYSPSTGRHPPPAGVYLFRTFLCGLSFTAVVIGRTSDLEGEDFRDTVKQMLCLEVDLFVVLQATITSLTNFYAFPDDIVLP